MKLISAADVQLSTITQQLRLFDLQVMPALDPKMLIRAAGCTLQLVTRRIQASSLRHICLHWPTTTSQLLCTAPETA